MNEKTLSRDFDYNLIKVLDAVISAGNASKAAKQLSVTPAAVSLALNRLQLFYNEDTPYQGNRIKSYQSDSITGIINIIEQTSLIVLFPLKLAVFHKNQRKNAINIIQPPSEMTFRPINIYASWKKKKPRSHMVEDIVTMLHTLSSFRR
ncbi:LysR family transcriptional regulator [Pseudescherichia vulneris]